MEDEVDGMRCQDDVNGHRAQVKKMLDRMHRESRPRSGDDVPVVQVVNPGIERLPVDEAVDPVEVEIPKQRDYHKQSKEPNGMIAPSNCRQISIRIGPQPDHNATVLIKH